MKSRLTEGVGRSNIYLKEHDLPAQGVVVPRFAKLV